MTTARVEPDRDSISSSLPVLRIALSRIGNVSVHRRTSTRTLRSLIRQDTKAAALKSDFTSTLAAWISTGSPAWTLFIRINCPYGVHAFPQLTAPVTNRTHCVVWSDYDTQPQVELSHGIRLDTNYYYYPGAWVNDKPGLFTGSGMPMKFMTSSGSLVDVYQATTQMTDESNQSYPDTVNELLKNALGPQGYYGVFTANLHTDLANVNAAIWAGEVVSAAKAAGIPVVSSSQMLQWLDGRNNSSFIINGWQNSTLSFSITVGAGARNLQAILPANAGGAGLSSLSRDGQPLSFTLQSIKGIQYAMFAATAASYTATYGGSAVYSISGTTAPASSLDGSSVAITGPTSASIDGRPIWSIQFRRPIPGNLHRHANQNWWHFFPREPDRDART